MLQIEFILGCGITTGSFPVRPQTGSGNVFLVARGTDIWTLIVVQPLVEFQVDKLGKLGRTEVTSIRFLTRVES